MTVHFLKHGSALCSLPGVPGQWPPGHQWVAYNDEGLTHRADCEACKAKLEAARQCKCSFGSASDSCPIHGDK